MPAYETSVYAYNSHMCKRILTTLQLELLTATSIGKEILPMWELQKAEAEHKNVTEITTLQPELLANRY